MAQDRDQLIEEISQSSLELDPKERPSFIAQACGNDEELKNSVIERIEQYKRARSYFGDLAERLGLGRLADPKFAVFEGQKFGKYEIKKQIGQGGMGMVYMAEDTPIGPHGSSKISKCTPCRRSTRPIAISPRSSCRRRSKSSKYYNRI